MRRLRAHMLLYRWGWVYIPEATLLQVAISPLAYGTGTNELPEYF